MSSMNVTEGSVFLSRYVLQKELGRGGYGRVFMALDIQDNTSVAVKISFGGGEAKLRNILETEFLKAISLCKMPDKNLVVHIKESFVMGDFVIAILELLSHNLRTSIKSKVFNNFLTLALYAKQMIEFLVFMSESKIIHCDIKPENILVKEQGPLIKFADFGLSHCPFIPQQYKLKKIQTLNYRSPEVILGYDYEASVDVWSVGCVLMECLIGDPLFGSLNELQLLQKIAQIIGTPHQEIIRQAPNRDMFFNYCGASGQWILKGFPSQLSPIGLNKFVETCYTVDVNNKDCKSFIALVECMLRLEPSQRSQPQELNFHSFFDIIYLHIIMHFHDTNPCAALPDQVKWKEANG